MREGGALSGRGLCGEADCGRGAWPVRRGGARWVRGPDGIRGGVPGGGRWGGAGGRGERAGRGLAGSRGARAGSGMCTEPGRAATMSAVDLGRVGACVLKHAVTGEVRPDGHGRWACPGTRPGAPATASRSRLRGRVVGRWVALGGPGAGP